MCFCDFPFVYQGEEWNSCVPAGSKFFCGTKKATTNPSSGTAMDGSELDFRCGIKGSLSSGFATRSMDYCLPADEVASRWNAAQNSFDVFYTPVTQGNLTLAVSIEVAENARE